MSPTPKAPKAMDEEREREIAKLREQVRRFDEKGYKNTAAHIMLARYLGENLPEAVSPQNAEQVKPEEPDGK